MGRSLAWTFGAGGTIGNTVIAQVSGGIMVGRAFAGCLTGKHATRRQELATYATPLKLLQVSFYIEHVVKPAAKRAAARSQAYVSIGSKNAITAARALSMNLTFCRKVILQWAETGARSGHKPYRCANPRPPLLSGRALNAEKIADTLSTACANISISLKELQDRGLLKMAHLMGNCRDRTGYYVRSFA